MVGIPTWLIPDTNMANILLAPRTGLPDPPLSDPGPNNATSCVPSSIHYPGFFLAPSPPPATVSRKRKLTEEASEEDELDNQNAKKLQKL